MFFFKHALTPLFVMSSLLSVILCFNNHSSSPPQTTLNNLIYLLLCGAVRITNLYIFLNNFVKNWHVYEVQTHANAIVLPHNYSPLAWIIFDSNIYFHYYMYTHLVKGKSKYGTWHISFNIHLITILLRCSCCCC